MLLKNKPDTLTLFVRLIGKLLGVNKISKQTQTMLLMLVTMAFVVDAFFISAALVLVVVLGILLQ
jgi:hypothetical protein